jgi:hypothetical protein
MRRIVDELDMTLVRKLVDQGLDILARDRPRAGHLRHGLGSSEVEAPEDTKLPCGEISLEVYLLGHRPQAVEERDGLAEDRLEGRSAKSHSRWR